MECPHCRFVNSGSAKFCSNCGKPLTPAPATASKWSALSGQTPPPAPPPAPRSEGERKLVTVLFADVVNSTSMAENLDPEQVADIMNGAFAFLTGAVAHYGGTVARLMGDGLLAFFGAPAAHEDDPERAVRAGLQIQNQAREYATEVTRSYGLDFEVRVGINTGLAVLDMVGSQAMTEYTAMGDTTNVASRMQSAARPATVLISADTYRFVKHLFDFNSRGQVEVKGKSASIEVYEVLKPRETPGNMRGLEGLTSPLVGRDTELRNLRDKLQNLLARRGGLVGIIGEAGLGKSRLIAEARKIADSYIQPQVAWLEGRAVSYGQSISYHPWRQIIRQSIGAAEGDSPESVRNKLRRVCTSNCCAMPGGDVPFLEMLLAVEDEESMQNLGGMSGDNLVQYITRAVEGHICSSLAEVGPTVLVFDDLHWADQASLDLLLNLTGLIEGPGMLVICLLRPDKQAASWQFIESARRKLGDLYAQVVLEPLSSEDSRELLGNLLRIEDLPDSVRTLILEKAEGNPFFVEEVIRSLIDSGYIVQEDRHWRATRDIVNAAIPDTLAGVLSARIDRLPGDTKRVTQAASVVGRIFAYQVLQTVCESAPLSERIERVDPHLKVLKYEELVRERTGTPELEYIFKHALTQEAAYNSLLLKRRKEFHRRTADALAQLYPERLDELAPTLALHSWQGEEWARAADYSLRAGAGAAKVYAMRAAIDHYQRAIEALEKAPDTPPEKLYDALLSWVQAAFKFTSYEATLAQAERAVAIARSICDKRRLAEALYWTTNILLASGRPTPAVPALIEGFALAEELGDERLSMLPNFAKGFMQMDAEPRGAIARLDQAIELAHRYNDRNIEAIALAIKAMVSARLGDFTQSREAAGTAHRVADGLNSTMTEADVDLFTAWSYLDMGDAGRALEHGQLAVQKATSTDKIESICGGYACVGFGHLQQRNLPEATNAFREAISRSVRSGAAQTGDLARAGLAVAAFLGGQTEAVSEMEKTLESARERDDPYTTAILSQSLGDSYLQLGDLERSERYLQAALDYYRGIDMRPYIVRALQSLASLHDKQGRAPEADRARAETGDLAKALELPPNLAMLPLPAP